MLRRLPQKLLMPLLPLEPPHQEQLLLVECNFFYKNIAN
jgi:hypothetical protein